jgi:hypothetical protein
LPGQTGIDFNPLIDQFLGKALDKTDASEFSSAGIGKILI